MSIVLNLDLCKEGYSLSFLDGFLSIKNGISGTTIFTEKSLVFIKDCQDDKICDNPMKKAVVPMLTIWGDVVDCCSHETKKIDLDPKNFGFDTPAELQAAIEALLP